MKHYLLKKTEAFTCLAYTDDEGRISQVTFKVEGYWGGGITIHKDYASCPEPARISYPSGGYESNPEKFKVSRPGLMNVTRAENFAKAMQFAAMLAYLMDENKVVGTRFTDIRYEREITEGETP